VKIYVPSGSWFDGQKPNDPSQKKRESSETAMKDEPMAVRPRCAGEDFPSCSEYDLAGMKLKANNAVEKVRKTALPPTDSDFDLKKGEVSQVFNDPQGYMI
jgi:hypothetical protein